MKMLELKGIKKEYRTGELVQMALDDVSLNFNDNEFVSILGPSGSGKTTLLNIIGGLDRYDDGDLVINGVSTKQYNDSDWDTYRNHSIGFVFQNYNLIPHQTILANVELALTIAGLSANERKKKARLALEKVGLGDQLHKKPNQMSGGQMQRVAIARALVNDPDILLADEPTGALDTETSLQIMELLKEVANDRLVIMVTHNPELAQEYSTRIVRLKDGKIVDDTNPCEENYQKKESKDVKKAKMSFATALSLSFNNLKTKKGRTLLTSIAGSIGIIGIALVLSLSTGVNSYIESLQMTTMTSYPITISATQFTKGDKMTKIANAISERTGAGAAEDESVNDIDDGLLYADYSQVGAEDTNSAYTSTNDLTSFKEYLDDPNSEINSYIGSNGIIYSYDVSFDVYSYDENGDLVSSNADVSDIADTLSGESEETSATMAALQGITVSSGAENFEELMPGKNGAVISSVVTESYDVLYGSWPENYDEVVVVLNEDNSLSAETLYQLGLMTAQDYSDAEEKIKNEENVNEATYDLSSLLEHTFYILPTCDHYVDNGDGTFTYKEVSTVDSSLINDATKLKVVGVVRPASDAENASIMSAIGYTSLLTDYLIDYTNASSVITAQMASPDINVLNGIAFEVDSDEEKVQDAINYLSGLGISDKAIWYGLVSKYEEGGESAVMTESEDEEEVDEVEQAELLDQWLTDSPNEELLIKIYGYKVAGSTYEDNMADFGMVSYDTPSSISIYVDSFEDKEAIAACIEKYNATVDSDTKITYTDYVSSMTSSVTSMIDMISLVLIAVVAVSLVVSCIMISIITHISVLERTKEIGILRALGASKKNISQVFNAETFIIGICAGLLGVIISVLLTIPINAVVASAVGIAGLEASLPFADAIVLIAISVVITVIGGLVPAKKAAKMDPVAALRSE